MLGKDLIADSLIGRDTRLRMTLTRRCALLSLAAFAFLASTAIKVRAADQDPSLILVDNESSAGYEIEADPKPLSLPYSDEKDDSTAGILGISDFLFEPDALFQLVSGESEVEDFFHAGSCHSPCCPECQAYCCHEPWDWYLIPEGLIYRSYLAGPKESRISSTWFKEQSGEGSLWDASLGGRVGVLRYGNHSAVHPEGWQLDIEGAAFLRLDLNDGRRDLVSTDFRFGVPLTYGVGRYQTKFGYYHISSHLGDEFIARTGARRINYVRDALVWGHSYFLTPDLRVYGEAAYSYNADGGAEPWEFQFGMEYSPPCPTNCWGVPFIAVNALLQEEHDFGGSFTVQAGWAWRNAVGRLFRVGFHYLNGKSPQFEFFSRHEEHIGVGIWYDY